MFPSFAFQNYAEIVKTLAQYFPFYPQEEWSKYAAIAFMFHNNALARVVFNDFYAYRGLVYNTYHKNNFPSIWVKGKGEFSPC